MQHCCLRRPAVVPGQGPGTGQNIRCPGLFLLGFQQPAAHPANGGEIPSGSASAPQQRRGGSRRGNRDSALGGGPASAVRGDGPVGTGARQRPPHAQGPDKKCPCHRVHPKFRRSLHARKPARMRCHRRRRARARGCQAGTDGLRFRMRARRDRVHSVQTMDRCRLARQPGTAHGVSVGPLPQNGWRSGVTARTAASASGACASLSPKSLSIPVENPGNNPRAPRQPWPRTDCTINRQMIPTADRRVGSRVHGPAGENRAPGSDGAQWEQGLARRSAQRPCSWCCTRACIASMP